MSVGQHQIAFCVLASNYIIDYRSDPFTQTHTSWWSCTFWRVRMSRSPLSGVKLFWIDLDHFLFGESPSPLPWWCLSFSAWMKNSGWLHTHYMIEACSMNPTYQESQCVSLCSWSRLQVQDTTLHFYRKEGRLMLQRPDQTTNTWQTLHPFMCVYATLNDSHTCMLHEIFHSQDQVLTHLMHRTSCLLVQMSDVLWLACQPVINTFWSL